MEHGTAARTMGGWRDPAAVFTFLLLNYVASAPRGVLLDDDGYFVIAAWSGGVAHPPGYPLYTLLAGLFAKLPMGTVAWRVHCASAVFAAMACVVLWHIVTRLTSSRAAAWTATLTLAWSATYWSQAVIADVYSLNVLLFLSLLYLCLLSADDTDANRVARRGLVIALLLGLSLSNHWPLMLLSLPALLLAALPRSRQLAPRPWRLLAPFCIGLLPYAWMVYRSGHASFAFLGPIGSWQDFWLYVSRDVYREVDYGRIAGGADRFRYAAFALAETLRQFSLPVVLLAATGFVQQWRILPRLLSWALVLGYAGSTFVLAMVLGFDWDLLHRHTFSVYPLPAYAIAALWVGIGSAVLLSWLKRLNRGRIAPSLLPAAVVLVLGGSTWMQNAPAAWRSDDRWAEDYAVALLGALEPGGRLFIYGDYATGPVAYAHHVLGLRPDVTLLSPVGQVFSNRLFPAREARTATGRRAIAAYIDRTRAPVYYNLVLPHDHGVIRHGLHFEVGRELPPGTGAARLTPEMDRFFLEMFGRGAPRDTAQLIHYRQLGALYCGTVAALNARTPRSQLQWRLEQFCAGFFGLMARAEVQFATGNAEETLRLLRAAAARRNEAVTAENLLTLGTLMVRAMQAAQGHREMRGAAVP